MTSRMLLVMTAVATFVASGCLDRKKAAPDASPDVFASDDAVRAPIEVAADGARQASEANASPDSPTSLDGAGGTAAFDGSLGAGGAGGAADVGPGYDTPLGGGGGVIGSGGSGDGGVAQGGSVGVDGSAVGDGTGGSRDAGGDVPIGCPTGKRDCGGGVCIELTGCCQATECTQTCQTCSNNACVAVLNADDPDSCKGTCDSTGTCRSKQGQSCTSVAGGCIGGTTCSPDGVCCDKPCKESCMACDLSGFEGICTAIQSGSPRGNRTSCGSDATCSGSCTGRADGLCAYPTTACGPATTCSSSDKILARSTCLNGTCPAQTPTTCSSGFACANGACNSTCTTSGDCQSDFFCSGGKCHSDVVSVGLAVSRTCAVLKDGRVMCWGYGYLGDNAHHESTGTPIQVANIADAKQVRTTGFAGASCALKASGTVACWGNGNYGQLGSGPQIEQSSYYSLVPVSVVTSGAAPLAGVAALSAGWDLFCATTTSATYCWGSNSGGVVGPEATYGTSIVSATVLPTCGPYQALAMGQYFQAGWLGSAGLEPWGNYNEHGEIVAPPTSGQAYSSCTGQHTTLPEAISEIVAGAWHLCVLAADKAVRCWGLNTSGQLGSGDTTSPMALPGARIPSFTATQLTAGRKFNCALTSDQRNVSCWGTNSSLQISADTTVAFYPSPTTVALGLPEGLTVSRVESSPEASHVCAIISDGSLMCWGNNSELETGTGAAGGQATPAFVKANW
jgi:alpha-tubulin suppressor-like RCC1 family protein